MKLRIRISSTDNDGNTTSEIKELKKDSCTIGRAGADLIVVDSGVSRRHAMLYQGLRGELRVMDLHSTNGTFLGEEKIIDHPIGAGTIFRIADTAITVLEFEADRQSFGANLSRLQPGSEDETTSAKLFKNEGPKTNVAPSSYSGTQTRRINPHPSPLRKA